MKITESRLKEIIREEILKEDFGSGFKHMKTYSSPEAKKVVDGSLKKLGKRYKKS